MAGQMTTARVTILGLRELQARFELFGAQGMMELQLELGKRFGPLFQGAYQKAAPKASPHQGKGDPFWMSINWEMNTLTTAVTKGFELQVVTSRGKLRRWLAEGTGIFGPVGQRIVPKKGKALVFNWEGQKWVLASVRGMPPNPWETEAYMEAQPLLVEMGSFASSAIVRALSDE